MPPLGGVQAVGAQLVGRVLEREAAPEGRAQLPVLRHSMKSVSLSAAALATLHASSPRPVI
eukprot:scaffold42680_cov67-Phaeocystis_antarctica.AAC.2